MENASAIAREEERHDRERREVRPDQDRERTGEARSRVDARGSVRTAKQKHTIHAAVTGTSLIGWIDWWMNTGVNASITRGEQAGNAAAQL